MRIVAKRLAYLCLALCALSASAWPQANAVFVHCPTDSINQALSKLNPRATNTVVVSGTCRENVVIGSFDRLTLKGSSGATIQDPSGGQKPTVQIFDSPSVTVQNFNILGGIDGLQCLEFSTCVFVGNNVQSSIEGIRVARSRAHLENNKVQHCRLRGLGVIDSSSVISVGDMADGNAGDGVVVLSGSYLIAQPITSTNNRGNGIHVTGNSTYRALDSTVTGNGGAGVILDESSAASFELNETGNTITGNTGNGVVIGDLSFAGFKPGNHITGNFTQPDVLCKPQFPATRGALTNTGGGTTNCGELQSPSKQ